MRWIFICIGISIWILFSNAMLSAQQAPNSLKASSSEPSESSVAESAAEMTDIHDIKPPEKAGVDPVLFYCLLLGALLLVLLFVGFYFWKKRGKKAAELDIAPLPPDVAALRFLDELATEENSDEKAFYFRLSAILRHYIRGRYHINAPEMTTEEFLPRVEQLGLHVGLQQPLRELFRSTDPIKFARVPAGEAKMKSDLIFVKEFVEQTTLMQNSE
ncbi:DUF4381 family protein [Thermodesulfobacteriota bacterium]